MKINYPLLLLFTLLSTSLFAQKSLPGFEKLTNYQLELNSVPFDKDAYAVILNEDGFLDMGGGGHQLTTKRRIKILNEKAIDEGNIELIYYAKDNIEHISGIKAQSINLVNGEYISTPITGKDIFEVDVTNFHKAYRFAIPNVKVGTIIEYEYILSSKPVYKINAWEFQHEYPTLESNFKIRDDFKSGYAKLFTGKNLLTKYKDNKNRDSWTLNNIPSTDKIKYVNNKKNVVEQILLQSSNFRNWKDIKKEIDEIYSQSYNPSVVKSYSNTILNGTNEQETLDLVVQQFSNDFKWNKLKGIYPSQTQKDLIKIRTSNSTDLNVLFNNILVQKGIKAELILLSSRSNGKLLTEFPFLQQFDYVVNKVTLNDGTVYLINAVDIPTNTYEFAPLYLFNEYGLLLDKNSEPNFVQLHQSLSTYDVDFKYTIKDGKITENRKDSFTGYFYRNDVKDARDITSEVIVSPIYIPNDDENVSLQFKNGKYNSSYKTSQDFNSIGNFITLENPFKNTINYYTFEETDRVHQIEFSFPYYYKALITSEIPDGYEVIVPESFNQTIKTNDKLIYAQTFAQKGNVLQILYEFYLGQAIYPATDYEMLKKHFEAVQKEAAKQITLKKK